MSLLLAATAGGTNYILVCDVGAYTYTGIDATLSLRRSLLCDTGTYAYTGQDATLLLNRNLACDTGVYTYTGLDSTLSLQHSLVCATGAYTYNGLDVTLSFNRNISCDSGAYAYTGNAAVLTYQAGLISKQSGVSRLARSQRPVFPKAPYISIDWSGQYNKKPVIQESETNNTIVDVNDVVKTVLSIRQEPVLSTSEEHLALLDSKIVEEAFFLKRRNMALTLLLMAA